MDKAILGSMRLGYFRLGVYKPVWEDLIAQFENVSAPKKIIVGGGAVKVGEGVFRVGVFTTHFEDLIKVVENV